MAAAERRVRVGVSRNPMQIAAQWYQSRAFDQDVMLIWEPHVHSFARCNMWYVKGTDRDLLIDSGTGLKPLRPAEVLDGSRHPHVVFDLRPTRATTG